MSVALAVDAEEVYLAVSDRLVDLGQNGQNGDSFSFECPRCRKEAVAIKRANGKIFTTCESACFRFTL